MGAKDHLKSIVHTISRKNGDNNVADCNYSWKINITWWYSLVEVAHGLGEPRTLVSMVYALDVFSDFVFRVVCYMLSSQITLIIVEVFHMMVLSINLVYSMCLTYGLIRWTVFIRYVEDLSMWRLFKFNAPDM